MEIEPQKDEESIYHAVLEKPAIERSAYLDEVCKGDAVLLSRIKTLLTSREQAGDFLNTPPLEIELSPVDVSPAEGPGTVIGRYKLLEKIGEGGMARVYMAEQQRPIHRKVALKIIKVGMDTQQVIARFEAERQALALMDYPHIAKVFDAGATETGRPYFVMELVQGTSITDYCDQNSLSTKDRLALFVQVCSAVQHAHQKGIIHRDIKPTNVMVTMHDGTPVPKIIDFGIAKATNQRLTEKTLFTRYAHIIGTPAYMSPEQAELSDLDVDTRTDIYSLGVLLYELLTGMTPFSEKELREAGYIEMQRVIREEEPTKPSTKLTTLGQILADVAKRRGVSPDVLTKTVHGDLDWIVMKSLEKDRMHRYETPSALGMDIQRYLSHEAVLARGPGVVYHVRKLLRRRRTEAVVALIMAVFLGVGLGGLSRWNRDRRQLAEVKDFRDENVLSQAHEFYAKGQLATALEKVDAILQSNHVGSEAQLLYAGILVEGRQPDEAVALLEDLLGDRPEIAGAAHSLLARVLWEDLSADATALKEVEYHRQKAKELLPQTAEAYFLQAMTVLTIKEKLGLLDSALWLDPGHYESRKLRAFIYQASRKYDQMKDDALAMIVLSPQNALGYSLRAAACQELGRHQEAIDNYERAIGFTTKDDPGYSTLAARCCDVHLNLGDYDRVIAKAQKYLESASDPVPLEFRILCVLTARGVYDEVAARYRRIVASNPEAQARFRRWSKNYVFSTLEAGRSWHPANSEPPAVFFPDLLLADRHYRALSAKARRLIKDGFTAQYSPDGKKIAFSTGFHGYSGVALYEVETGQFDLLIAPGKDPAWSPDGQYLAFVRDCRILPLADLTGAERANRHRALEDEEIWMMNADGTAPRRLAFGSWPRWSHDKDHLYFHSFIDKVLYKISTRDGPSDPERVLACPGGIPEISPDGKYVAYAVDKYVSILELASGSLVAEWTAPLTVEGKIWSSNSRQLCLGVQFGELEPGWWVYDVDKKQASRVLEGLGDTGSIAPDKKKLIFHLKGPYYEIWQADLDPDVSMFESLGPGQTIKEYYQGKLDLYTQKIEADPGYINNYVYRAQYNDSLRLRDRARADMDQYIPVGSRGWSSSLELGPTVDHAEAPYVDRVGVFSDWQPLPLAYNNVDSPFYSEIERTFDTPQNWTINGANTLRLFFRGNPTDFLERDDGTIVISGGGKDIWYSSDEFRFAYKPLNGDGSIVACIDSLVYTHDWAKVGVMIRESPDPHSAYAFVFLAPGKGVAFHHRRRSMLLSGGTHQTDLIAPYWVKLTRKGNTFTAERSEDGITWSRITASATSSSIDIDMPQTTYIGLAVTSCNIDKITTAEFSSVAISGDIAGPWQVKAVGVDQMSNDSALLYVAIKDEAGRVETVTHPDWAAVLGIDWQEWLIPFSEFGGIDLANVKTMYIGVGDQESQTPRGTGLIYLDDISFGRPFSQQ
jgi:tetratricopeptide (TPR) repeat protein